MAKTATKPQQQQKQEVPPTPEALSKPAKAELAMTTMGFQPTTIEAAYRYSETMAASDWVKPEYRRKAANCMILLDASMKMGVPWLYLMQHIYFVHECPALDGQITISLINQKGGFTDPLDYEVKGTDAFKEDYMVRAYATRKSTGKILYGPWITWKLVKGEGWDKRSGSKWLTMPDQMFHYRAASWFANRHCPEVKMGMPTVEEAEEVPASRHVESQVVEPGNEGLKKLLADREQKSANGNAVTQGPTAEPENEPEPQEAEPGETAAPEDLGDADQQTQAKVAEQKAKLQTAGANGKRSNLF